MTATRSSSTLASDIALQIQNDILAARLQPGQKLRAAPLCDRFGVSLSVVREALTRLAETGLVTSRPQFGFAVMTLRESHLHQLTDVRVEVEGTAVRWATIRGSVDWESNIVACLHTLNRTPSPGPESDEDEVETWSRAHRRFHLALAEGCDNEVLLRIRGDLYDASEVYRRSLRRARRGNRDIAGEHNAIAQAAIARRGDEAVSLLTQHLRTTTEALFESGLITFDESAPVGTAVAASSP